MTTEKPDGPRNIALIGPYLSGKTTLLESILFATGAIDRKGSIAQGNTVGDASAEARERQMSTEINAATTEFLGDEFTFLDCPGSIELIQETANALAGADAAEERRLRALRDRLAEAAGLTHRPGHDAYMFHVTLAYLIAWPGAEEAARIDHLIHGAEGALAAALPRIRLGAPEVCLFTDMTAFRPQFTL